MLARPTFGDTQGQLATSADSKGLLPMATSTIASKKKGAEIVKTTKTLSHTKYEDQRRRDLCCWCDNKFSPGHQCLKRQAFSISVDGSDKKEEDSGEGKPKISVHTLDDSPSYHMMKVTGFVGRKPLQILIDLGSMHNFLSASMGKQLGCSLITIPPIQVTTTKGGQLNCDSLCKNFTWYMQGQKYFMDVMLVQLESYDMILGIQWLQTLGDILWNFGQLQTKFHSHERERVLMGNPQKELRLVGHQMMTRLLSRLKQVAVLHLQALNGARGPREGLASKVTSASVIDNIIVKFQDVFDEPKQLLPHHDQDHRIALQAGASLVNIQPYQYPPTQMSLSKWCRKCYSQGLSNT